MAEREPMTEKEKFEKWRELHEQRVKIRQQILEKKHNLCRALFSQHELSNQLSMFRKVASFASELCELAAVSESLHLSMPDIEAE